MHRVLLYPSEIWAATQQDVSRLKCNDMMIIKWICSRKLTDKIPSDELRSQLCLCSIDNVRGCLPESWASSLVKSSSTYESRDIAKKGGQ